jgi:site-specific DNA-methyltransferase (adenine-specific)
MGQRAAFQPEMACACDVCMVCFQCSLFFQNVSLPMPLSTGDIHHGDARALLPQIEDESVALSVWSPPYHVGKGYEDGVSYEEWQDLLRTVIRQHFPILQPGGFLAVNIADILCFEDEEMPRIQAMNIGRHRCDVTRQDVLEAQEEHPEMNRYELADLLGVSEQTVDRRLHGNNIRGGKYRTQTRVNLVGGFIQDAAMEGGFYPYDRRIWRKDPAWQNSKWHTLSYRAIDEFEYVYIFWKPGEYVVDRNKLTRSEWREWGSRAVWEIRSVRKNDDHEAKFPLELPRRVIKLLSEEGDTVLDCFMGSGTTARAAIREGRRVIGIELLKEYAEAARRAICEERNDPSPNEQTNGEAVEGTQLSLSEGGQ